MKEKAPISLIDQHVIDFVTKLREDKNLTKQDIANIISVDRSFISHIERGNPDAKYSLEHINALADYFNLSPKDFMPKKAFPV